MSPRLFVLSGSDLGRSYALEDGALLGRSPECQVPLRDGSISRVHAKVERRGDRLWLVDQGSRNGLWLAGQRVRELALGDLVEFKVGDVLARVRLDASAPAPDAELEFDVAPKKPAARLTPEAPPSAELELELEEIVLEEEPARAAPSAPPRAAPSPAGAPATAPRPAPSIDKASTAFQALGATKASPALETRGQRVLQYHKIEARSGWLSTDLEQRPAWVRLVVIVLAMALCAAVSWFAFKGTTLLRERAQDPGAEPVQDAGE